MSDIDIGLTIALLFPLVGFLLRACLHESRAVARLVDAKAVHASDWAYCKEVAQQDHEAFQAAQRLLRDYENKERKRQENPLLCVFEPEAEIITSAGVIGTAKSMSMSQQSDWKDMHVGTPARLVGRFPVNPKNEVVLSGFQPLKLKQKRINHESIRSLQDVPFIKPEYVANIRSVHINRPIGCQTGTVTVELAL